MTWDVAVVGAGASGALAAERLRARGLKVALLEAGPRLAAGARVPEVDRRDWSFRSEGGSFDWYRVRAVGGRALLWGGWAYRLPDTALRRGGFPWNARVLAPYYREVEARLHVLEGPPEPRYQRAADALEVKVRPRRAALLPDGKPWSPVDAGAAQQARIFAAALQLEHARGRAGALAYLDLRTGNLRRLRARAFVLAASPIETARILLESELGPQARTVGRGLVDHLVASYVLLEPRPVESARRAPLAGGALVEPFVNVGPRSERDYPGSFAIELSGPTPVEALGLERMVAPGEAERWSATELHAMGELFPHPERFVSLDPQRKDALGRREPIIHVALSDADARLADDMKLACVSLADRLAARGSRLVPLTDGRQLGAGHEAGTCAMGRGEASACDRFGRLLALENVWVADASALPTAGDRHPTLTLLAHALRSADAVTAALA